MDSWITRTAAVVSTKTGKLVVAVVCAYAALKLGLIPDDLKAEVLGGLGLAIVMALRAAIGKVQAAEAPAPVTPTLTYSSASLTSEEASKRLERGRVNSIVLLAVFVWAAAIVTAFITKSATPVVIAAAWSIGGVLLMVLNAFALPARSAGDRQRGRVNLFGLILLVAIFAAACVTVQSRDELTIAQTRETADRLERTRGYVIEEMRRAKADPKVIAGIEAIFDAEVKRVRELAIYEEEKR